MNKVASYLGNVGKSVGFMAVDVVKDYTTASSEFIAQNKDLFKEIYSGIRNYRQTVRRTGELIKQTTVYDSGNKLIGNIFDDIRTGNFYNRERIDKYEMEALGMDDFNLEMNGNSKDDLEVEITAEDRRASHTEAVIENAVAQSSNLISSTTAKTGQYIVSNMHASDQMRRVENSQLLHSLATGFTSVQSGISNIINFANGPLVTHMQNSTKYYENSIKLMQEQNAMFKEFLEMQREQYKAKLEDNKKEKLGYDDVVGVEGTPDLKAYGQMIAKNTKNLLSSEFNMDMILGGGLGGKKGSMLNALLASPISSIATMAMRTLIPTMLKETAKTFNESIQGVFSTIIGRLNRAANDDNSGILGYIGKIFGIKNILKKDMSAGQYKKGPVPFDGHTRNTIINVIPSYLRRIEAALTNQPERVYDPESGKWTSAENVKDTYEKKKKSFRDNAVGDVEKEAHDAVKKLGISDRREEKRLLESISSVLTNMYERGGTFNFNKKNLNGSDYGVADQEMFENAIAVLNALSFKSGGKRGNKNIMALDSNIMRNRSNQTKFMDEQSLNNTSIYGLLASGDIDPALLNKAAKAKKSMPNFNANNPLSMLDKDGNTAYYYMRSILAELRIHRKLLRIGGGTVINENGRTVRNNMITIDGNSYNIDNMTDSDIDKLVKSSGEKSERQVESMREISQNERHKEKAEKIRKENGFNDIDFSDEKLARSMIRSNIQTLRIREEIDERKANQSYDGSIIKAGRDASNRYERRKRDAKKGKGTFMDQLVAAQTASEKLGVIRDGFAHLTQKPAEMIQGVIESADTHLYNFFFGENDEEDEDGNPIKGFIGKMTHELKNSFNKFNEWMTEKLFKPIMKKLGIESWEDIPRKIFGFFTGNPDAWDDMKRKAGDKVREGLKPYGEAIKTAYTRTKDDVVDAFTGVRDDYYNFRGIDRTTLKGREEIKNRTLSEEERMANIKANDKYGGGYTLDVLREAKGMNFKDKTQRKNYIKAETLRRQGYNIKPEDILNANESEEAAAKLNKLIERAEGQKDKELKRQNMGEIRRKYGIKTSGRRKQMNRYIEDEGYFDGSLEKRIETIKNKIEEITAQGKEVSDEDKSLLANLQKKFGLVSDDTKAKKSELDNIDKEFKEIDDLKKRVESLNQELFPEEIEKHSRLLREKKKAEKNYRSSLRDDLWNDEETRRKFIDKKTEAIYDKYNKEGYNIATHAKGARYITKSGITTISQGEMIIPSELNPYNPYRFSTNKAAEIANEEAIRTRFSNKLAGIIKNRIHRNAEGNDPVTENEDATQPVTPKDAETVVNSEKASEKIVDPNSIIGTLERGISSVGYSLFGKEGQTKEQFDSMMSGVIGQVKSAAPDAVGNGLLGGTLGLLIGGPGAIMMGAAAGAAKGIIGHSESLQNFLFGEIGEDNERTGGVFSKKFQQNFKKFFPDMKNYGIVGGLTLFPFLGPIGGILAGSAIGFAKNSDKLQDYLFGEVNPETGKRDLEEGLIGGANKEKLKKAFPYMGAGAIAGLALGPFGILGNAALGAGVGLLSSTDKFKDIMFGEEDKNGERHGGILGAIRTGVIDPIKDSMEGIKNKVQEFIDEDILEPLKEFIEPFTHGAKNFFGALLKMVGHGINKLFENTIGIPLDKLIKEKIIQPLTGFVSKTLKFLTAPIRAIVSSPFKFLGSIGNLVRKGQIKRGTADDMTADQRMKFRARHWMGFKPDKYREADSKMAGWFKNEDGTILTKGDEGFDERAEELRKYAQDATDAAYADEDFFMKRKSDLKNQTSGNVSRWFEDNKKDSKNDRMIRDRILRAINKGNIDKASAYIRQANLSRKESEELQEMIDDYTQQHKVEDAKRKKVLGNKGALEQTKKELAEKFGIKNINDKDVARLAKDLNTELKANGLKKVKPGVGENDTGTIANILNDKVPGENPLTNVIAKGMEKALEANHKKLERVNQKKDKLGQKYGRQIAKGNSGNTRTSEEFDDYIGSRGKYGIKEFGNFMGDAIKGRSNILSRSKFLPFKLAGGAIHLATTPFRTAKGLVDWSMMAAREKSDRKVQRNIAGSMEEMSNGQMDTGLGDKLMRMGKNGEKQSISHTYKLAKGTNKFNLTEAYLDGIRYHTDRQRRDSDKVAHGKGFNNLDDLRQFTESSRADRRYIKKQGWKLKGMDTDDINNLSGLDQYKIKKSHRKYKLKDSGRSTEDIANDIKDDIETHALGGLILKTAGKAAIGAVKGATKLAGKAVGGVVKGAGSVVKGVTGLGKKVVSGVADFASGGIKSPSDTANEKLDNKTTSVVSEHEAVINANQKESSKLLEDNKKDMKAMTDTAEENVEVDKNQLSVLKEIKSQLSDIWKTQDKSLYQKITDTGKVIRIAHSKDGGVKAANDKDTKEAVDSEQKHRNIMSRIADGIGGLGDKLKGFLGIGVQKDDDGNEKSSWFDKLKNILLTGLGGTIAVASIGHFSKFWDDTIKPWLTGPVANWLSEKLGIDNPDSAVWKIAGTLDNMYSKVVSWFTGDGVWKGSKWSLPGIIKGVYTWTTSGLQLFSENVLPKAVELIISTLPSILMGLGKGIVKGLGKLFSKIFKWGGAKEEDSSVQIKMPPITKLNPNSKPFTTTLMGLSGTDLNTAFPSYNSSGDKTMTVDFSDGSSEISMDSETKTNTILNQLNGGQTTTITDGVSAYYDNTTGEYKTAKYDANTKIGGYTLEELTSGTVHSVDLKAALNDFAKQENLSEEEYNNLYNILSTSPANDDSVKSNTIRTLITQNINGDTNKKRETIRKIMAVIYNNIDYYKSNGFTDDQVEEVYPKLYEIATSFDGYSNETNRLNDIQDTIEDAISSAEEKHGLTVGSTELLKSSARSIATGGIQNFRVGKGIEWVGKITKHIPLFKTAGTAIEGAGKGISKGSGLLSKAGKFMSNLGDNFMLGAVDQAYKNSTDAALGAAMEAGANASKEATERALQHTAGTTLSKEASERVTKKYAQNAAQTAADDVLKNAAGSLDGVRDKLLSKTGNVISSETGEIVAKESVEKAAKEGIENAAKEGIENAAKNGAKGGGLIARFTKWVGEQIMKLFGDTKVVNFVKKMAGKSSKFAKEAAEQLMRKAGAKVVNAITKVLGERIVKAGTAALAKITSVLGTGGTITLVFAVGDFISGCLNAESIMGVTKDQEISWGQRLCAGLVKCINGFVTLGFIPESILYDLFIDILGPMLGFDTSSLQEMREEAQKELDEYNLENGTNLTMEEYNKKDSWWTKTKNKVSEVAGKAWDKTKEVAGKAWDKTKEVAGKAWEATKKGAKWLGNKAKDAGHYLTGNIFNDDKIREELGLDPDTEITLQDRISMGGATLINKLTFGTVDTEKTVKKINGAIEIVKNKASDAWEGIKESTAKTWENLKTGAAEGLTKANEKLGALFGMQDDQGNPISLTEGISDKWNKWKTDFKQGWENVKTNTSKAWNAIKEGTAQKWEELKTGAAEGLTKANEKLGALFGMQDDQGNPISLTEGISDKWNKWKTDFKQGWENVKTKALDTWNNMKESTKESWEKLKENATKGLTRIDERLGALFGFEDANGNAQSLSAGVKEKFNATTSKLKDGWNSVKEKASSFWDGIKNWFGNIGKTLEDSSNAATAARNAKGKGKSKYGKGKISQLDPSIADMEYNGNTIAEAGCGPVAATNLINNLKGNGNITVKNAAQYATEMGYKPENDGTDPKFMNSILSASGIENRNISGRANIKQNLAAGNPVVLMGKGNSEQSPYGKYNPHYITAMGYDSKGNIIIDDPYESDYTTYKESDVMNGVMKSTVASRGKGFGRKSRHSSGFGKYINRSRIATRKKRFGYGRYGSDMPVGSYVEIPSGLGTYETYMGWHMTTYKGAPEYEFKQQAIKDGRYAAKESCGMTNCATVDDRLVIATVANIGGKFPTAIGDYLDVYFEDGTVWKCIRGETKSQKVTWYDKAPADAWGHDHGKVVVEVVYHNYSKNPKNNYKKVKKIVKAGDYASGKESSTSGTSTDSATSTSTTSTASTSKPTLFGALSELGTSMVKKIYGEDVYEAIFGSTAQAASTSDGSNSSSGSSSSITASSGTAEKFVQTALAEEGYHEKASNSQLDNKTANSGSNNYTKYGKYYGWTGPGVPWCAQFVSWAADHSGVPADSFTRSAAVATIASSLKKKGKYHAKNSGYTPKRGDIFTRGTNHIGIVTGITADKQIKTIEGNSSDKVAQRSYDWNSNKVTHFGDLGIGAGTGTSGMEGTSGSTKVYGKMRFGRGKSKFGFGKNIMQTRSNNNIQGATVMNLQPNYRSTTQRIAAVNAESNNISRSNNRSSSNYIELLKIVIEALLKVADNTEKISMIYDILADKLNIDVSDSRSANDLESKKTKVNNALKRLDTRQTFEGNTPEVSDLDIQAILQMMTSIARE